jgi:hypothetical protein
MQRRGIKFLLLASLLFWTTGAALFFHERFEHADHQDDAVTFSAQEAAADHAQGAPDSKHKHSHDHDDCPTCQLLAQMQAEHGAMPAPICLHELIEITLHLIDRHPPVVDCHASAPIRGPPAIA